MTGLQRDTDMEWVSLVPVAVGLCGVGACLFIDYSRRKQSVKDYGIWTPQVEWHGGSKKVLTARDRSEIYQDMAWWDREFRKLSGEPEPVTGLAGDLDSLAQTIQLAMKEANGRTAEGK